MSRPPWEIGRLGIADVTPRNDVADDVGVLRDDSGYERSVLLRGSPEGRWLLAVAGPCREDGLPDVGPSVHPSSLARSGRSDQRTDGHAVIWQSGARS